MKVNANSPQQILKLRTSNRSSLGYSLVETMVAISVGGIVCITALAAIFMIVRATRYIEYSSENEEASHQFAEVMTRFLGSAVNVDWEPTASTIGNINGGRGKLLRFVSGFETTPSAPVLVGSFLREAGRPNSADLRGDIRATALFFSQPTPEQSGKLYVSTSPRGTGTVQLASSEVILVLDQIVELQLDDSGLNEADGDPVGVVEVRVVHRKFLDAAKQGWQWCPEAFKTASPLCVSTLSYRDIERVLQIPLANNALKTTRKRVVKVPPSALFPTGEQVLPLHEAVHGDIYFFDFIDLRGI